MRRTYSTRKDTKVAKVQVVRDVCFTSITRILWKVLRIGNEPWSHLIFYDASSYSVKAKIA